MEYPITKLFDKLENNINPSLINIKELKFHIIKGSNKISLSEIIDDTIDDLSELGYAKAHEKYIDILNIDRFNFYADLEIDGYYTNLEFNIKSVYSGLTLLDFDDSLWYEGQSEKEIALWKTFRVFDTRPEIGDGKMAVFSIKKGEAPPNEPEIYFIDRETAYKTNLTFVQYYEAVLDMLGIANWQYLYTNVSFNDPVKEYLYDNIKESLNALQKALPDKNYQKYFDLLEARNS